MISKQTRGIIFDLDGTLYRMRWYLKPLLTWRLLPHVQRLPRFIRERSRYAGVELDSRDQLLQAVSVSLAKLEKKSVQEMREWIEGAFYPAFVHVMRYFCGSRPGLNDILQKLKTAGIRLAVLSDYDLVKERLELLKIEPSVFDFTTSSESMAALKPSPKPFLRISEDWNIPSSQILVIGDRDDTDGSAANSAGMSFLKIRDNKSKSANPGYLWDSIRHSLHNLCS